MKFLKPLILEKYKNLFDRNEKLLYVEELYNMLQKSYESIGGIKGKGFSSPQDIADNIPIIKMVIKKSEIICAIFYKDKDGRKAVALTTNGTREGSNELKIILEQEFRRSYMEVSHMTLRFIKVHFPKLLEQYKIPNNLNLKIFDDIIPIDDYYYKRKIGDQYITKLAIGTPFTELY